MPYRGLEGLGIKEECVLRWAQDLNPRTARNYAYYLLQYLRWAKEKGYWPSAEAMLREYEGLKPEERFRHLDILKQFVKSRRTGTNDRRISFFAVRSFYDYHGLPLPKLPRSESSKLFRPSEDDKRRALELTTLKLDEVQRLILNSPQPYKAALMVMFQGAMGLAEFEEFNLVGWRRAVGELDKPGPLRIDLYRGKTSRTSVSKYYTFIGEDGKRLIKEWLAMRPEVGDGALFLTYNRTNRRWVPLRGFLISNMITKVAKRLGLIKPNQLKRYHIHAHELRDLFKSLCTLNGVHQIASEFFLGHNIDKLGYDKSPQYDEEWFRNEYRKVEPRLNIISNPSGGELERRVEEIKKEALLGAIRRFAEIFGIDPVRIKVEKERELGKELSLEEEIELVQSEIKRLREGRQDPQKIVKEEELEGYLEEGWQFVSVLPSQRILVRKVH